MKLQLVKGSTSKQVTVFVQDSSSSVGAGLTGLVFNTASLSAYYYREGAASATAITLATMTLGTWATGGFVVVDGTNMPGVYSLGLPDAALASGANSVVVMLKGAADMAPVLLEIQLTDVNLHDPVRGGMTALPNAAAEAAGGLFTRGTGAGQINQAANGLIDVNAERLNNVAQSLLDLKDFADDGYDPATNKVQGVVLTDTVTTYTGNTPQTGDAFARLGAPAGASVSADIAAIEAQTDDIGVAGAGLTAVPWNPAWDAEVQSEVDDALVAQRLDELLAADSDIDGAAPPAVGSVFHELLTKTPGSFTYDQTTDSLEALADTSSPSAAVIADAVWDEALAGHLAAGSTGEALNAAGSAGDPWVTALPGAYGAGSAGNIVGTNLNATVSSRASQASVDSIDDFLDTEVAAILADTNELQTDWADGGRLDLILDARASQASVDDLPTNAELATSQAAADDATLAAIAAVQADTDNIQTRLPAALVGGRMDSIANAMGTDVLTSTALATSAVTEIQSGLATQASVNTIDDFLDTEVAAILAAVDTEIAAIQSAIAALNNLSAAQVNAEVLDVLTVDTCAEITSIPAAATNLANMICALYAISFNEINETATLQTLRNRADTATIGTASVTDDATTAVRGSFS